MAEILQYPPEWLVFLDETGSIIKIIFVNLVTHSLENHQFTTVSLDVAQGSQ